MNNFLLEVDGVQYEGWTEVTVTKSLENFAGSFQFVGTTEKNKPFPIKRRAACKVIINNFPIINGWVEIVEVDFSSDNHQITVSGRDRTNDILDSKLDNTIEFNSNVTLKQIVKKVLKELNLTNIKVIDRFNLKPFTDIEAQGVGTNAFDALHVYAKKAQVLLTTTGDGNIAFERASTDRLQTILSTKTDANATILSSKVKYDDTKRFNLYKIVSSGNLAAYAAFLKKYDSTAKVVNINSEARDNEIRNSRIYVFKPDDNHDDEEGIDRAKWEANYRKSQSAIYTCEVQGVKPLNDEGIWTVNKIVKVFDEYADIDTDLLISDITYSQNLDRGTITTLKLVDKDSFTLLVNKPEKSKKGKGNNLGNKAFSRLTQ